MLQVVQYQKDGRVSVEQLPAPQLREGGVLVRNAASLISTGTEKASLVVARASLLKKARLRPDLVRQVRENVRKEGLLATFGKVRSRLDTYKELGYSCSGVVLESATDEFKAGDHVACGGAEYAHHAEIVFAPRNLVVKLPEQVLFEEGAFVTLGAVALQGIRQSDVRLGEVVLIIGLGLVGLLTTQLLRRAGCHVVGLDISSDAMELAGKLGCQACSTDVRNTEASVLSLTNGFGADAVIITASGSSSEPIEIAVHLARKKGRVIVVGDVPMDIPRRPFYEKELELKISCSYGPGRYDHRYEANGQDYPLPYVRWTERRNMEVIAGLLQSGELDVRSLISHRISIADATRAYELIVSGRQRSGAIIIEYPKQSIESVKVVAHETAQPLTGVPVIGAIGAGNFARTQLFPLLKEARLKKVATLRPPSAMAAARAHGFEEFTTDPTEIFEDPSINTVIIATRHDSHAVYAAKGLALGKHVFVEKPLAISSDQLDMVVTAHANASSPPFLMVGFNRRFSPAINEVKKFLEGRADPLYVTYRVNAGELASGHWLRESGQGGRVLGEVCHFVDLIQFVTNAQPVMVYAESLSTLGGASSVGVTLRMSDGSVGVIHYLTNGDEIIPKEFAEFFCAGKSVVFDNFRRVTFRSGGRATEAKFNGSKGHREEINLFLKIIRGEVKPCVTFESAYRTTLATLSIEESLRKGKPIDIS